MTKEIKNLIEAPAAPVPDSLRALAWGPSLAADSNRR